jgi:RimJ/RimL family protein N-acetyltransferase
VLRHGFERLGLGEIIAVTTPGNARSLRVMERLGMGHFAGGLRRSSRVPDDDPLRHTWCTVPHEPSGTRGPAEARRYRSVQGRRRHQ